jgi:hypothetical protein
VIELILLAFKLYEDAEAAIAAGNPTQEQLDISAARRQAKVDAMNQAAKDSEQ